jgi:sucrose-6-phosphate hydrolase SacC (GH32 family)
MKKTILILLVMPFLAHAQIKPAKLITNDMSLGKQSGLQILVPEASDKQVTKAWEDLMKEKGAKTNKVRKFDELLSESAVISSFGEQPFDVFASIKQSAEGSVLQVYIKNTDGFVNFSENAPLQVAAKTLLANFAKSTALAAINDQIKEEEKNLKKLNKDHDGLVKDQKSFESDIKDAEELISKRIKQLEKNASDQEVKEAEIATQKNKLQKVKSKLDNY